MGKRRKGSNKMADNRIKAMASAVSSDEGAAEGDMVFDDVDRWDREQDTAAMAVVMKGRGKKTEGKGEMREVLALSGTDSDSDLELATAGEVGEVGGVGDSDLGSGEEEEEDIMRWGSKKKHYYGGNTGEELESELEDSDMEEDRAEEREAAKLQSRQLAAMDEEDFLDTFILDKEKVAAAREEKISAKKVSTLTRDLSQLSKKEQLALLTQQSPEFEGVVADFESKMAIAVKLSRVAVLAEQAVLPSGPQLAFVKTKLELLLNYCTNVAAYVMFKAEGSSLTLHPITGRLLQCRQLLDKLEPLDAVVMPGIENMLQRLDLGEQLSSLVREERRTAERRRRSANKNKISLVAKERTDDQIVPEQKKKKKSKKRKQSESEAATNALTKDERMAVDLYNVIKKARKDEDLEESGEDDDPLMKSLEAGDEDNTAGAADKDDLAPYDEEGEEKRAITYKIAKNKGLMPKRSKLQRNPRLKNRVKFEKAEKRRKGAVRAVRDQNNKYSGEASGVNVRVKKGVKLS